MRPIENIVKDPFFQLPFGPGLLIKTLNSLLWCLGECACSEAERVCDRNSF